MATKQTTAFRRIPLQIAALLLFIACVVPANAFASDWTSQRGNAQNNGAITSTSVFPRSTSDAKTLWTFDATKNADATVGGNMLMSRSNILVVGNYLYFAAIDYTDSTMTAKATYLYKVSKATGVAAYSGGRVKLAGITLDLFAGIAYDSGVIYVTSTNQTIGAYNASDGSEAWTNRYSLTATSATNQRIYTPITVSGNYLYFGTMIFKSGGTTGSGAFLCVNKKTGEKIWEFDNASCGFYWTGAAVKKISSSNNAILVVDDSGTLRSFDEAASASSGNPVLLDSVSISAAPMVHSSVVLDGTGTGGCNALFSDNGGCLDIVPVAADGTLGNAARRISFATSSSSTPAVLDGRAYVGGVSSSGSGVLAIIDVASGTVVQTATVSSSGLSSGSGNMDVKSSPLVVKNSAGTYAYFFPNNKPGTLYSVRLGSSSTAATAVFTPDTAAQQYCIDSAVTDGDGNLYFTNDSSVFFAIGSSGTWIGLGGDSRYDTMQLIVDEGFGSASTVIVASGANSPDALAASALAGALDAPIVLTDPETLSEQASDEIASLGATKAIIVGGTSAVSSAIQSDLASVGSIKSVSRISGQDRFETARAIYSQGIESAKAVFSTSTCIIATGIDFPDSLSISPFAYAFKVPIFLTDSDGKLDPSTESLIKSSGFTKIILVGGTGRVSDTVKVELGASLSYARLAGDDRYETSSIIAAWTAGDLTSGSGIGFGAADAGGNASFATVGVATGKNFPDALAGAALVGKDEGVLLLADPDTYDGGICTKTGGILAKHGSDVSSSYFFGGTNAISESIRNQCRNDTL